MARHTQSTPTKRDAIVRRAATVAQDFREMGDAARQIADDSVGALRETASDLFDEGRDRARNVSHIVQKKVQDRPMKSLLVAAGFGFLVGLIFWRR
jgi:ElaB/YqjD/DUF883 family membrane-anchored ribosome-binding protein